MNHELGRAMNATLSGLYLSSTDKAQIMSAMREEQKVMKKKMSIGLVLAIVLLILTIAALAASQWDAIIGFALKTEQTQGSFATWSLSDKKALIEIMRQNGINMTDLPDYENRSDQEADELITNWIESHYSGEVASLHYTILEKAKGHPDTWSLEDKAWYSNLLLSAGMLTQGDDVNAVPSSPAVSEEKALQLSDKWLIETYSETQETLDLLDRYTYYCYAVGVPDNHYWYVNYRLKNSENIGGTQYGLKITDTVAPQITEISRIPTQAEIDQRQAEDDIELQRHDEWVQQLEAEKGPRHTWSLEDKAIVFPYIYGLPTDGEISEEEAIEIAKAAVIDQLGENPTYFETHEATTFFIINDPEQRYYTVNFETEKTEKKAYSVHVSSTGEVLIIYSSSNG